MQYGQLDVEMSAAVHNELHATDIKTETQIICSGEN
jgi:hypothetical protein